MSERDEPVRRGNAVPKPRAASHRPLRLTLVTGSLGGGGTERIVLWLASSLADAGYAPTLLTLHDGDKDFYEVPPNVRRVKGPAAVSNSNRWFDLVGQFRSAVALRRLILDSAPDVVLSFIDSINTRVIQALSGTGIPVLASEQTDWRHHPISARWRVMRCVYYRHAHRVVVLSSELHRLAVREHPSWRSAHVPNPVPRIAYRELDRPQGFGPFNVMAMGRLAPEKGFDLLLKAFKQATQALPTWKLVILGEGPERQNLTRLVDELSLRERVLMPGALSSPFDWLHAGDLFVFSSRYEGFGLALAEAMACALPVISFNCPSGPQDIVRHEVDGLLVPANNVEALAQAMKDLMNDPERRARFARRGPDVCERFAPDRVFAQWQALVEEAAGRSNGVRT